MSDLIRREDALAEVEFYRKDWVDARDAIAALPAVTVGVKPLVFRDETGDGVLTSRETGELFRIFPQKHGGFAAPKLPEPDCYADDAQTLIDRLNARWSARILAALEPAPTDAAQAREAALREAAEICTYVIKNMAILKADGETYETPRVQKIARGLVDIARQDILALIGEART